MISEEAQGCRGLRKPKSVISARLQSVLEGGQDVAPSRAVVRRRKVMPSSLGAGRLGSTSQTARFIGISRRRPFFVSTKLEHTAVKSTRSRVSVRISFLRMPVLRAMVTIGRK